MTDHDLKEKPKISPPDFRQIVDTMNDAEKIEALVEAGNRLESVLYSGGKGVVVGCSIQ